MMVDPRIREIAERVTARESLELVHVEMTGSRNPILRVYTDQTAPVVDFYRTCRKLICVYGVGSVDEVLARVLAAIREPQAANA